LAGVFAAEAKGFADKGRLVGACLPLAIAGNLTFQPIKGWTRKLSGHDSLSCSRWMIKQLWPVFQHSKLRVSDVFPAKAKCTFPVMAHDGQTCYFLCKRHPE
jgi:hypothetical protein